MSGAAETSQVEGFLLNRLCEIPAKPGQARAVGGGADGRQGQGLQ